MLRKYPKTRVMCNDCGTMFDIVIRERTYKHDGYAVTRQFYECPNCEKEYEIRANRKYKPILDEEENNDAE